MAHYGTKGYYVKELKKLGIRQLDGYKLETYKAHVLRAALEKAQSN